MAEPWFELVWSSESEAVQFIRASVVGGTRKRNTNTRSQICTSLSARSVSELTEKAKYAFGLGADLVEFRLDHLKSPDIEKIRALANFGDRSIFTVRASSEGGGFRKKEEARLALIKELAELEPAYFDVELRTLEVVRELPANSLGKEIIVSWHDQNRTPGIARLHSIMARAASHGGLVKIVTTARTASDNLEVLSLYDEPGPPPIAFCMGVPGIFSRVMAMERGSPIIYGSLPGEPIAPGQLSVIHLLALQRKLENA